MGDCESLICVICTQDPVTRFRRFAYSHHALSLCRDLKSKCPALEPKGNRGPVWFSCIYMTHSDGDQIGFESGVSSVLLLVDVPDSALLHCVTLA